MKQQTVLIFAILFFGMSATVHAGMPQPLCDAVRESDFIIEVTVDTTVGRYPDSYAQKNWSPPESELPKIFKTAKIAAVHKGKKTVGEAYLDDNLISAGWGQSGKFWADFFAQKQVTVLTGNGGFGGWLADGGDYTVPFAPMSYQKDHEAFKKAVLQCLTP